MARHNRIGIKGILKAQVIAIALVFAIVFLALPPLEARAYNRTTARIVTDAETGEILYAENAEVPMEIASTTKILTAICVIEHADVLSEHVIPEAAVGVEGSSIYLRKGEKWRVLDLLYGLMLRSGNDAATALAIITSGSVEAFTETMNETAARIGATASHFTNPHGLHDEAHLSSAADMAKITAYALENPIFAKIARTKTHHYVKTSGETQENGVFYNKNKFLYTYDGAIGVKTGYTKHSGRCLVSAVERDGRRLICVVLNESDTYGVTKSLFDRYIAPSSGENA